MRKLAVPSRPITSKYGSFKDVLRELGKMSMKTYTCPCCKHVNEIWHIFCENCGKRRP